MVTALECFQKAQRIAPNNPLSYVNAARTYQQLNQVLYYNHIFTTQSVDRSD